MGSVHNDFTYTTSTEPQASSLGLYDRFKELKALGLLAHENKIGEPERAFEDWSPSELQRALAIFRTWPQFTDAQERFQAIQKQFAAKFGSNIRNSPSPDRIELIRTTCSALTKACKAVLGDNFPEIRPRFIDLGTQTTYSGLAPDGYIDFNTRTLNYDHVEQSDFPRDLSYVELAVHETIHLVQEYLSEKAETKIEDSRLSARVAQAFYESTFSARGPLRPLYWEHPFEVEARDQAKQFTASLFDLDSTFICRFKDQQAHTTSQLGSMRLGINSILESGPQAA